MTDATTGVIRASATAITGIIVIIGTTGITGTTVITASIETAAFIKMAESIETAAFGGAAISITEDKDAASTAVAGISQIHRKPSKKRFSGVIRVRSSV